jgi:hypothetical protein
MALPVGSAGLESTSLTDAAAIPALHLHHELLFGPETLRPGQPALIHRACRRWDFG